LPLALQQPGITINLAEYRLYLVWEEDNQWRVRIYPIGLGRDGWLTPEGEYQVANMIENPVWTMPAALREENPQLPAVIPPGPENPLGSHWIGLSQPGYGIHGTNRPYGIGRRVSHGCIRLYPDDIRDLVKRVARGMAVKVIYQPIKLGRQGKTLYLEAHKDYLERFPDAPAEVRRQAQVLGWQQPLLEEIIAPHLVASRGVPQPLISREAGNRR
jgi:L,D-transpeptidase ErfK/SrfK